jgi:hypothetical protein
VLLAELAVRVGLLLLRVLRAQTGLAVAAAVVQPRLMEPLAQLVVRALNTR